MPKTRSSDNTTPPPQRKWRKASLELSQHRVGRIDNARPPSCARAAGRNSLTGIIPLDPISPSICTQSETNAIRKIKPRARKNHHRALKLFARNFWKPFVAFLGCGVVDRIARDLTPALDPAPAEMAFAVPDNERLRRRIINAYWHVLISSAQVDRPLRRAMLLILRLRRHF